jgi:gamma-butyrobetaine dioxygenase
MRLVADASLGLAVLGPDGTRVPIHPLWLRERSTAAGALDPKTGQRLYNPSALDPALAVVTVEPAGAAWHLRFSDGHAATYSTASILEDAALRSGNDGTPSRERWDATLDPLPKFEWDEQASDADLLPALETFLRLGFVIFRQVPPRHLALLDVARRFGFPRETNFGTLFDVRSVPDASDLAYTSLPLEPHTDNPYRDPVPGIQLLHCLINGTEGGLSTLVDGRAVADALADEDPAAFDILAETEVRFRYADRTTELVAWAPLIERGSDGRTRSLHVSSRLDFVPLLPASELDRFYAARRKLDSMLKAPAFELRFRLDPGDLLMFDNGSCLHGRTGFSTAQGERHLQGCYIDLDGPRSLYRVLARRK